MDSQNKKILNYLKTHKRGLTSFDAFRMWGITRLSARIMDLRSANYNIDSNIQTKKNSEGQTVRYAAYVLKED